jgi:uncharacterized protein (DUF1778 family)
MSPAEASVQSEIEAIDEPRTAWMDQRTKPSVKASIEAAADLMGIEASAFVVMSAYARAQELLRQGHTFLDRNGDGIACKSGLLRKPNRLQRNLSQRSRGVKLATNRAIVGCCNC